MTVRPRDYGDRNPSDIGDVPPFARVSGFAEADYQIQSGQAASRGFKMRYGARTNRATDAQQKPNPVRDGFNAVIVKRVSNNRYKVLRQDGRTLIAQTYEDESKYDGLREGDLCVLQRGSGPDVWYIQQNTKNKELSAYAVSNNSVILIDEDIILQLNELETDIGKFVINTGTGLKIQDGPNLAVYHVSWSVNAECINPDDPDADPDYRTPIWVDATCQPQVARQTGAVPAKSISFRRNVGFIMGWEPVTEEAIVSLNVGETDYMPMSPAGGGDVVWTNEPWISGSLKVGTQESQGWIKIVSNGGGEVWLGHGAKTQKIKFPNNDPQDSSHLIIGGKSGDCIQLKWTKQPGRGDMVVNCSYCDLDLKWKVEDGLIISGPGINPQSPSEAAICQPNQRRVWNC